MAREAYQRWRPVEPWGRARRTARTEGGEDPLLNERQQAALKSLEGLAVSAPPDPFPSAAQRVLQVVQEAIPFDAAWVVRCAPGTKGMMDGYLHQLPEGLLIPLLTPAVPLLQPFHEQESIALRGSDLNETEYWLNGSFYLERIVPLGLIYPLAGLCIDEAGGEVGMVTLWRAKGRPDFSRPEGHFLERASTPLGALLRNLSRSGGPSGAAEGIPGGSPGVLVLGGKGEILFMNESAAELLNALPDGGALSSKKGGRAIKQIEQLRKQVLQAVSRETSQIGTLPICDLLSLREKRYSLRGIALEGGGKKEMTVMILIEPISAAAGSSQSNERDFGLTEREKTISRLIGQGLTNKEIASSLGIGIYTVKDHIKNILKKVEASSRAGLVAKLMGARRTA